MGRHPMAAVRTLERCLRSTPTAQDLPPYILSLAAAMGLSREPASLCRATHCTEQRPVVAVLEMARCSPSTPTAPDLGFSTLLQQALGPTATGSVPLPL